MMTADDQIQLRNPDPSKKGTRIARDMYAVARRTVLAIVPAEEPGITLNAMAMKLDLEARGELRRINARPPQRLVRTGKVGGSNEHA